MRKNKSNNVALAGILSALIVVMLLLGNLLQLLDLSMAALGGLVILIALIEMKPKWALGVYAVSAILALLISPQTASVVFAGFVGYYPVAKLRLDKIKPRLVSLLIKLVWFNLFLLFAWLVIERLLGLDEITGISKWVFIPICNFSFLLYDLLLEKFAILYVIKIRPKLPFGKK